MQEAMARRPDGADDAASATVAAEALSGCGGSDPAACCDPVALDGTGPGGHAAGMDAEIRRSLQVRLRRIEGQVRGLQRMIDEERWCADVLGQINAVQEALRGVSRGLLRNHLAHCAADAVRSGDQARADEVFDELTELMFKSVR